MKNLSLPVKVFLVLIGVMACLLITHLAMQHLNLAYDEKHGQIFEVSNRLDVDDEASVPTWFSQAIWIGVALASGLAYYLNKKSSARWTWLVMVGIGVVFSIDEVSGLHELSLQSLHLLVFGLEQPTSRLNAWWLVLPVILVLGTIFLRRLYKIMAPSNWFIMLGGWMLFMTGAVGFELYGNDIPHNTFYYQGIITAIEEGLEMLGGIIVLYAILRYLSLTHGPQIKRAAKQLSA